MPRHTQYPSQTRTSGAEGIEVNGGFNLSPRELLQPDLAARILGTMDAEGVATDNVLVEVSGILDDGRSRSHDPGAQRTP